MNFLNLVGFALVQNFLQFFELGRFEKFGLEGFGGGNQAGVGYLVLVGVLIGDTFGSEVQ